MCEGMLNLHGRIRAYSITFESGLLQRAYARYCNENCFAIGEHATDKTITNHTELMTDVPDLTDRAVHTIWSTRVVLDQALLSVALVR